jgi:gluconolactonase
VSTVVPESTRFEEEGKDGVSIFDPAGKPIGRIDLPERCANLCFGGRHRNRQLMAASTSI